MCIFCQKILKKRQNYYIFSLLAQHIISLRKNVMDRIFTAILISFVTGIIISPLVIFFAKKLKTGQNIYEYVDMHKAKQGTPTMGGLGIMLAIIVGSVCVLGKNNSLATISIVIMLCFGVVGFLDDLLKIIQKQNLGLRPYQKMIGQFAIALIVTIFAYKNTFVGSTIFVPFSTISFNLGWWFLPFCLFVFLATVNAVNLTDGLDGLAGGTTLAYLFGFSFVCYVILNKLSPSLQTELLQEQQNLLCVCGAGMGSLLAYLLFNCFPAKIFMGDTGSLALGGLISCLAIFMRQPLLILVIGLCFVLSALSVVLQVGWFKLTKKRIFLMAPFHHHLEKKSIHENRIVAIYIIITLIIGVCGVIISLI